MTAPLVIPANLQWVGIAKETTPGTPVATPTAWIPVDGSSTKYKPNQTVLTDTAYRGQMSGDYQQVAGMRYDTLDYKCDLYLDSVYQHFLAVLGRPDAISGSADPYTHKTSIENGTDQAQGQPMTFTVFWYDGVKCQQIPGCKLADLKLDVKVDEPATLTVQWMGLPAATIAAPTNTPTTAKPMPSWRGTITYNGVQASDLSEVQIDFKRDAAHVPTINNSQTPLEIFDGVLNVTGTLSAIYQGAATDTRLVDYLANNQRTLSVKVAPVGDANHYLLVQMSLIALDTAEPQGNKWMEIQSQFKALANATDALDSMLSPAQVQILSPASTAY